jgi:hypothetical protein
MAEAKTLGDLAAKRRLPVSTFAYELLAAGLRRA